MQGTDRTIEVVPVNRIIGNTINSQVFQPVFNGTAWTISAALGNGNLGALSGQWFIQSGVNLTFGTVTSAKYYYIASYVSGDDFTNIGALANATGVYFLATNTTPNVWTHASALQEASALVPYNVSASALQTALNNTAFATAAGGTTVILEGVTFLATFTNTQAVTTMIGNGGPLAPLTIVDVAPLLTGSASAGIQSVQTIQLIQNPGAYQVLGNASAAAAIVCTRLQVGGGGYNETWQVVIDPRTYAGVFNLIFTNAASAVQTSAVMVYNVADTVMQTTLQALTNIGSGNLSVTQIAPFTYILQFIGSLANTAINANAFVGASSALLVPLGRSDTLNLMSSALQLILNGDNNASITFEIDGTPPGGNPDYLYQGSTNTLKAGIVPPNATTPAPTIQINPNLILWGLLPDADPGANLAWLNGTAVNVGP